MGRQTGRAAELRDVRKQVYPRGRYSDGASVSQERSAGRVGWKEAVAAIGVILSLVFVALELRQNTKAIQATVRNDLASASREWTLATATSPELAEAEVRWVAGDEMTEAQLTMVRQLAIGLLRNVENVYLQVQNGSVDESALVGYGFRATPLLEADRFLVFWQSGIREKFNPDFVEAFEAQNTFLRPADPAGR